MLSIATINRLEKKGWTVKSNGFYITLYKEDFKDDTWKEMCKIIGCSHESTEVTVLSYGYINK